MPLSDLFKSKEQKGKEAKESEELRVYSGKKKIENKISILKKEKAQLKKKAATASPSDENALLKAFANASKELKEYEQAREKIIEIEAGLRGGSVGGESLNEIISSILVGLDNLTTQEKTGGISEDVKNTATMNIEKKLDAKPANSEMETLGKLSDLVYTDDDDAMSLEEARAELFGERSSGNDEILARMAEIEKDIK